MAIPDFSMRQLLEAGVHFGHQAHRWNPKMTNFIFGTRNNIHIIDLAQTVPLFHRALQAVSDTVAKGGRILFVGTKRQAQDAVADAAKRSAQYYVNSRWLGGTLTNWKTISGSIKRLRALEEMLSSGEGGQGYTKKERLTLQRERDKLDRALGGIKDMGGVPDLLFVIDTNKEDIAIKEARRLNLPVAAVVDTNSDPNGITFPVPGNDDASRAITLYCDLIARAAIDGISRAQGEVGMDTGAAAEPIIEPLPAQSEWKNLQPLSGPRGVADDLRKLSGMSGTIEKQLNDLGIFHFWQIADLAPEDAHKIGEEVGLPGRAEGGSRRRRSSWRSKHPPAASVPGARPHRASGPASVHFCDRRTDFRKDDRGIFPMAEVTAQMVKELRDRTGAGMMDCKAALAETGGDMEAAVDLLRKKGLAKAAKKAGRVAAEGLIGLAVGPTKGVIVEVNSETDFVARNEQFQALVKAIAEVALKVGADVEAIKAAKIGNQTVAEAIASAIATIGENITLRRAAEVSVGKGVVASYVHNAVAPNLGKIGVLVALESTGKPDDLGTHGRQVAMHVASANPQSLDSSGLDPAVVARERAVVAEKAKGKPDNVVEKIIESGLKTFYKEVCLHDQAFVFDDKKSVAQALKEAEGKVGGPIKIAGYVRFALGEGIERPDTDFSGEVAAMAGQ